LGKGTLHSKFEIQERKEVARTEGGGVKLKSWNFLLFIAIRTYSMGGVRRRIHIYKKRPEALPIPGISSRRIAVKHPPTRREVNSFKDLRAFLKSRRKEGHWSKQ